MENINFEHVEGKGFVITDFPAAEKVISLKGDKAQELADMALHRRDLLQAANCLDSFSTQKDMSFEQEIFWRMAIIYFTKCFGKNNARKINLDIGDILGDDPDGLEVFQFFKDFRDKNIAHDDNSFMQCLPGAVINKVFASHKIAKIVCMSVQGEVSSNGNIDNLRILIEKSRIFVENRFNQLCDEVTIELEQMSHEELVKFDTIEYSKPNPEDMSKNRGKSHIFRKLN